MKKRYLSVLTAGLLLTGGIMTAQAAVTIMPNFNGTASAVTDLVVAFDATQSTCYQTTYNVFEDGIEVSCTAGVCANNGAVSCSTYTDCLDTCELNADPQIEVTCVTPAGTDTGQECTTSNTCQGGIYTNL